MKTTHSTITRKAAHGLIGLAIMAWAGAAMADDAPPTINFKYDARSLATESGAREVYRRLVRAAEKVCPEAPTGTRLVTAATLQCRKEAVARAVQKIDSPRLATIDTARGKRS